MVQKQGQVYKSVYLPSFVEKSHHPQKSAAYDTTKPHKKDLQGRYQKELNLFATSFSTKSGRLHKPAAGVFT